MLELGDFGFVLSSIACITSVKKKKTRMIISNSLTLNYLSKDFGTTFNYNVRRQDSLITGSR